jgi:diaminopimelate decarboxylase
MRDEQSVQDSRLTDDQQPNGMVMGNDGLDIGTWGTMSVLDNGHLAIGGCDSVDLAAQFGTPLFVYDVGWLRGRIREILTATRESGLKVRVSYASKAFCTTAICQLVHEEGLGLDVVSGGELYTALQAGVPPTEIHMHGNNKSWAELEFAVSSGIGLVIVDNDVELGMLSDVAERLGRNVDILLRISPGVEAHTHEFISTGQQDSKFGFDLESGHAEQALAELSRYPRLKCVGLHSHIGSQIFEPQGFTAAVERMLGLYQAGLELGVPLQILNVGGGFGIRYTAEDNPLSFDVYMGAIESTVTSVCGELGMSIPDIWLEPGRVIVGPPGTTLYTVGTQKSIPGVRNYVSVDGGMTDNPRLALYGAKYDAVLANRMQEAVGHSLAQPGDSGAVERWSVAGKCCETGDMLIWDATLPHPNPGDILAVFSTGAYNYSMASHYNRNPKPAVVFVENGEARVVVERETWADMVRQDRPLR